MMEILASSMFYVVLLSAGISLVLSLVQKYTVDQDLMRNLKQQMNEINKKVKEAQKNNDQSEMKKLQKEMMEISSKQMKMGMKTMMISFVIIIPIFVWAGPALFGHEPVVQLPFKIFGTTSLTWIWWYIVLSLPISMVFRKALGVVQ